jgi:polysaccharide deacetylase family protein (PEP-CTERM system associated)
MGFIVPNRQHRKCSQQFPGPGRKQQPKAPYAPDNNYMSSLAATATSVIAPPAVVLPPARSLERRAVAATLHCLSVDVEEYFQCEVFAGAIPRSDWTRLERRARPALELIAELLARHRCRATFFVLGWLVERLAPLLRELRAAGHEIACHGYAHEHLARLSPRDLAEDLRRARSVIEDVLGLRPRGYRAPTFSVTRRTAWALDVIAAAGFHYDSSIFPVRHDRYGVPDAPLLPFRVVAPGGARLLEFPPLTLDAGLLRLPLGGGGYLRLLPEALFHRALQHRQRRGQPTMLYLHPWELDPDQPTPAIGRLSRWRHRVNLEKTAGKLERLLERFTFDTAANVLQCVVQQGALPEFTLAADVTTSK